MARAADFGLDLRPGDVEVLADYAGKADIVILSHVLEHVPEPRPFLRRAADLLHPEGVLYVEVPGIDNPKVRARGYGAQPGHLLYFSLETLRRTGEAAGQVFVHGNATVQALFRRPDSP